MARPCKPNKKEEKIMVSLSPEMKIILEKESKKLWISESAFIRLLISLYHKNGGLKADELFNIPDLSNLL